MIDLWFELAIYICSVSVDEYSNETALSAELSECEVSLPTYIVTSIILWMTFAPHHCKTICSRLFTHQKSIAS